MKRGWEGGEDEEGEEEGEEEEEGARGLDKEEERTQRSLAKIQ